MINIDDKAVQDDIDRLFATLRYRRQDLGLSQAEIAKVCGVTRVQITNIESGRYGGNTAVLARYARAVGLRLAVVTSGGTRY